MKKTKLSIILLFFSFLFATAQTDKKIGLVLSGGGALGYAHVGVIQALEEHGISPQYIAGTSMGAIVGVLYADGYMPDSILSIVKEEKLNKVRNLFNIRNIRYNTGASSHKALLKVLGDKLSTDTFEKLKKEYHVCVTDLDRGEYEIVDSGNKLTEYVVASASIPGVFETEIIDSTTYVDGGVLNNLPAQALREKCDVVIGVDVLPYLEKSKGNTAVSVVAWSIRMMQHQNSMPGRNLCDFIIEPDAIRTYNEFSFEKYQEIYRNGYDTMNAYLNQHPELIQQCGGTFKITDKE
jgi:NTE family protein